MLVDVACHSDIERDKGNASNSDIADILKNGLNLVILY